MNTLAISYNDIVQGYKLPKGFDYMPSYFNFEEGWNEPPLEYGDSVYIAKNMEKIDDVLELVSKLDRSIDQVLIYAGSLSYGRHEWVTAVTEAFRSLNINCRFMVFICDHAESKTSLIRTLADHIKVDLNQWFEQNCGLNGPVFDWTAPNLGEHSMWYYLMVCRRYGQKSMIESNQPNNLRLNPKSAEEIAIANVLGDWILQI